MSLQDLLSANPVVPVVVDSAQEGVGVGRALVAGVISLPACTDGSWIMAALALGLDTVTFFPAEASGRIATIKALSAAFPGLRFMPTGGVSAANLADYLCVPVVAACGGSWMVKKDLVKAGAWEEITRLSAEAVAIAKECGR